MYSDTFNLEIPECFDEDNGFDWEGYDSTTHTVTDSSALRNEISFYLRNHVVDAEINDAMPTFCEEHECEETFDFIVHTITVDLDNQSAEIFIEWDSDPLEEDDEE
jgi:hypothetical protein